MSSSYLLPVTMITLRRRWFHLQPSTAQELSKLLLTASHMEFYQYWSWHEFTLSSWVLRGEERQRKQEAFHCSVLLVTCSLPQSLCAQSGLLVATTGVLTQGHLLQPLCVNSFIHFKLAVTPLLVYRIPSSKLAPTTLSNFVQFELVFAGMPCKMCSIWGYYTFIRDGGSVQNWEMVGYRWPRGTFSRVILFRRTLSFIVIFRSWKAMQYYTAVLLTIPFSTSRNT